MFVFDIAIGLRGNELAIYYAWYTCKSGKQTFTWWGLSLGVTIARTSVGVLAAEPVLHLFPRGKSHGATSIIPDGGQATEQLLQLFISGGGQAR